jgi:triacylglycerol esterase/lipase EstA (alpha/beta hydrolase family)
MHPPSPTRSAPAHEEGPAALVPAPPAPVRGRWRLWTALLSLLPVGCASLPVREKPAARDVPVLLVHGIDDDHRTLATLRGHLLAQGFTDVETVDLTPNDGSGGLPRLAHQVRDAADRLRERTGAEKVDVVAFSMGALVTRYWLMRLDGKPAVRRFVSISGPHHGTLMACFRHNEGVHQMRPDSPLLADLATDEAAWGPVEVVSFWTPLDLMIFPARSSVLAGASHRSFMVLAHPLMLRDGRVLEALVDTLRSRRPTPPPAPPYPAWP